MDQPLLTGSMPGPSLKTLVTCKPKWVQLLSIKHISWSSKTWTQGCKNCISNKTYVVLNWFFLFIEYQYVKYNTWCIWCQKIENEMERVQMQSVRVNFKKSFQKNYSNLLVPSQMYWSVQCLSGKHPLPFQFLLTDLPEKRWWQLRKKIRVQASIYQ